MTREQRVQRGLRAWRDSGIPVSDPDEGRAREDMVVAAMRRSIGEVPPRRAREQRSRRYRWALLVAACLGCVLAAVFVFEPGRTPAPGQASAHLRADVMPALLIRAGSTRFAEAGAVDSLQQGDEVSVPAGGRAELTLPSRATVQAGSATRLQLPTLGGDEVVNLVLGEVDVSVPKLQSPHTLSVVTPDARVVVHGTAFTVTVAPGATSGTTLTSVAVREGEVAVVFRTGHVLLRAGQSWHSGEPPPGPTPPDEAPSSVPAQPPPSASASARPANPPTSATVEAGPLRSGDALADQNRLYRAALAARAQGDDARTVELLSELLSRYPSSPLSSEAVRERDRARARMKSDAAP